MSCSKRVRAEKSFSQFLASPKSWFAVYCVDGVESHVEREDMIETLFYVGIYQIRFVTRINVLFLVSHYKILGMKVEMSLINIF